MRVSINVRMCVLPLFALGAITLGQEVKPQPAFSPEQAVRLHEVASRTRTDQAHLRTALVDAQHKLAACYSSFELDSLRIEKHQDEIINLQRNLLESHDFMQKDVREIVGSKGFAPFMKRVESATDADRSMLGLPTAGARKPATAP